MIIKAREVRSWNNDTHINGEWIPARPYQTCSVLSRIKQAWGVLTGKYDALDWEDYK